jgi:nucleoside-diphosphate-sugar epimerase
VSADTLYPLARLLERLAPRAIVNCTGSTVGEPGELHRANVDALNALIAAMRRAAPRCRLVHIGSAAEYAEVTAGATNEDAPLDADTPYAAAKLAASRVALDAAESGLDAVVARLFNPIGPGMPESSLPGRATRLLQAALDRGDAEIGLGPLDAVRDYLDLRDVATAVLALASTRHLEHRVYNVGSGRPTVVRELVRLIAGSIGFTGVIGESASPSPRSSRIGRQVADIGRIRSLGWTPTIPLRDSVDALVAAAASEATER